MLDFMEERRPAAYSSILAFEGQVQANLSRIAAMRQKRRQERRLARIDADLEANRKKARALGPPWLSWTLQDWR